MHDNLKELAANPPNFIKNNITFFIYIYKKKKRTAGADSA